MVPEPYLYRNNAALRQIILAACFWFPIGTSCEKWVDYWNSSIPVVTRISQIGLFTVRALHYREEMQQTAPATSNQVSERFIFFFWYLLHSLLPLSNIPTFLISQFLKKKELRRNVKPSSSYLETVEIKRKERVSLYNVLSSGCSSSAYSLKQKWPLYCISSTHSMKGGERVRHTYACGEDIRPPWQNQKSRYNRKLHVEERRWLKVRPAREGEK